MHPTLIKANIALFRGVSSEARRLLDEYIAEEPEAKDTPLILWLAAQSQAQHEARLKLLDQLAQKESDDVYVQMAERVVEMERRYQVREKRSQGRLVWGVAAWKAGVFALVGGVIAFIVFSLTNGAQPGTAITATPTSNAQASATPLLRPTDDVLQIDPTNRVASYQQGRLQVSAFVLNSQRVVTLDEAQVVTSIPGAQFYALYLTFDCLRGICDSPPEATLSLMVGDAEVPELQDVKILGEAPMTPIAAGARTMGWVVFEVPSNTLPSELKVFPLQIGDTEQEPINISAPVS